MTSKNAMRRQSDDEMNPKSIPAPNSNTEKEPDDSDLWDDPMTTRWNGPLRQHLVLKRGRCSNATKEGPFHEVC